MPFTVLSRDRRNGSGEEWLVRGWLPGMQSSLSEAGVAVLAGTAFGTVGKDNLRLSYANSQDNLARALDRMRALLASL